MTSLLDRAGVSPSRPYSPLVVRKAVSSLFASGAIRDVRVEGEPSAGGVALSFHLTYRQGLVSLDLRGHHVLGKARLLQEIQAAGLRVGAELTDGALGRALVGIHRLYQDAGYFRARATPRLEPGTDPHSVRLEISLSEGERTKIARVRFTGEKVLSDRTLYGCPWCFASRPGEYYSRARLEKDRDRLLALYADKDFLKATIAPPVINYLGRTNEVEILIEITASNRVSVRFEGVAPLGRSFFPSPRELRAERQAVEERLRGLVLIQDEQSDDDFVLEQSARSMEAVYRENGYPFVKVAVQRKEPAAEGLTEVLFSVDAGPRVRIGKIRFEGNRLTPTKRLQQALSIETGDDYLVERIEAEPEALERVCRAEGLLKAEVRTHLEWSPSKDRVAVVFQIEEGPQTRVARIDFTGTTAFPGEELRRALRMKEGSPYNNALLQEDRRTLLNLYRRQGYLQAEIEQNVETSEDQGGAALSYAVTEGPQVRVGRIILQGNAVSRDPILRRELLIHTGDPLDLEKVLKSQKRLYRLGLFSEVRFEPSKTADPALQDLLLLVKERPTGALEFGVGYADYERLRGFVEVTKRNLFGTGRSVSLRADGSRVLQRYGIDYREPWIFSRDLDGRAGVSYSRKREISYRLNTLSASVGLDKSFSEKLKGLLLYQYERDETSQIDPAIAPQIPPEDSGGFNIASINPALIFDARDDLFNPTRGFIVILSLREAAKVLGSEKQFLKGTAQITQFFPLRPWLVLALSARGGAARTFAQTREVPLPERFLAGGRSTVRGYDQDRLGIPGVTLIDGRPTGGDAFMVFNEELRLSLPASIGLVVFFDHGNVWPTVPSVRLDQVKSTTGTGLRYNTPVGPLRLDYGYKLDPEEGESRWALHFTLGHAF
jgi:outer membrane protein insertion porin family